MTLFLSVLLAGACVFAQGSPPVLLLHGDNDMVLPVCRSTYMLELSKQVGADVQLITVRNGGHGFSGENISPTMPEINRIAAEFMISKLKRQKN